VSNTRDVCDVCGSDTFSEGRFSMGKLWCAECFSGQAPPVAMPVQQGAHHGR